MQPLTPGRFTLSMEATTATARTAMNSAQSSLKASKRASWYRCRMMDSTEESKPVHVLTVTLKPGKPGDLNRVLRVVTDLTEDHEIDFQATARMTP